MIKYECMFRNNKVGYLEVNDLIGNGKIKCSFMPYRSKAHLKLAESVKCSQMPFVILKSEQHTVEVTVIDMAHDFIVVEKKVEKKKSFLRKIFNFS